MTAQQIEILLPRKITPVKVSWAYRLGLLAVAILLILLQAVYIGMIALAAWGTYVYITYLPRIIDAIHINWLTIVLVATPIFVGSIVTFFLMKPFLAKPAKPAELLKLSRDEEPILFAYVDRLCWVLGAPPPHRDRGRPGG